MNVLTHLGNMTMVLKSTISCELLTLLAPFDDACFGHAMSKVAQYAINDNEISKYLMPNFINEIC